MTASLGGIRTLVFTGGIGQHAAVIRSEIASGLAHLGITVDEERNPRSDRVISTDASPCKVSSLWRPTRSAWWCVTRGES